MRIRGGYLILLMLLPMAAAGKAAAAQQQQQPEGKRATNDYGPWIQISSAVLQLVPDEQTQLLLLQTHEGGNVVSTASHLPNWHHIPGLPQDHEPRHSVSDNLDFERQPTHYIKSHGR